MSDHQASKNHPQWPAPDCHPNWEEFCVERDMDCECDLVINLKLKKKEEEEENDERDSQTGI